MFNSDQIHELTVSLRTAESKVESINVLLSKNNYRLFSLCLQIAVAAVNCCTSICKMCSGIKIGRETGADVKVYQTVGTKTVINLYKAEFFEVWSD